MQPVRVSMLSVRRVGPSLRPRVTVVRYRNQALGFVTGALFFLPACGPLTAVPSPIPPSPSLPTSLPVRSHAATITPTVVPPFSAPAECSAVAIDAQQWRFDCGEQGNRNARGTLNPPLTREGWRMCGSGLATAQWGKAERMVTFSEGSGIPGEGFLVRVDPITPDCALKVSTADPTRGFEVMAQAFAGSELGWVAARWTNGRALFHTADGGRNWMELNLPAEVTYVPELRFVDVRNGWMVGSANRDFQYGCDQAVPADIPRCRDIVFRTRDGGRSWTSVRVLALAPAGGSAIKDIQFVDAATGWLLERDGPAPCELGKPCFSLLSTADGGDTWRTVLADTAISDLHFVDRTHGWGLMPAGTSLDAMATADGGTTWSRQIAGEEIWGLSVPSVDVAIALARAGGYCTASLCNKYGLFRVDTGQLAAIHETATSGWWAAPGCGGFLGEPFFIDATRGWIGLQRGVGGLSGFNPGGLLATSDGGATWSCVPGLPSEDVLSVWFADPRHGWVRTRSEVFGSPGPGGARVWRTDDGGRTWRVSLA